MGEEVNRTHEILKLKNNAMGRSVQAELDGREMEQK